MIDKRRGIGAGSTPERRPTGSPLQCGKLEVAFYSRTDRNKLERNESESEIEDHATITQRAVPANTIEAIKHITSEKGWPLKYCLWEPSLGDNDDKVSVNCCIRIPIQLTMEEFSKIFSRVMGYSEFVMLLDETAQEIREDWGDEEGGDREAVADEAVEGGDGLEVWNE